MYTFTEEEFLAEVVMSRGWGESTDALLEMMEELIIEEARSVQMANTNKAAMIESSIDDFESNLLQNLIMNTYLESGDVISDFKSSICCTFKHHMSKTNE